jgi:hypothetical protein
MKPRGRRGVSEFNLAFLDVISCGFGAVILLLIITRIAEPILMEQTTERLESTVAARTVELDQVRGEITVTTRQLTQLRAELDRERQQLTSSERELSAVQGEHESLHEEVQTNETRTRELAVARQTLTDEQERLLGADFRREDDTIGGITVDSEYIVFVIDTSGSMQFVWPLVIQKLDQTLSIHPEVKGIQVLSDMGDYMFAGYQRRWIPDSPARRRAIVERMRTWAPFSNSSPVEGIEEAIRTFWSPDAKVSIYVFGDDFTGRSVAEVLAMVDRFNAAENPEERLVRIHAVGFPVLYQLPPAQQDSLYRFGALMREMTYRNNGTFVGLPNLRPE